MTRMRRNFNINFLRQISYRMSGYIYISTYRYQIQHIGKIDISHRTRSALHMMSNYGQEAPISPRDIHNNFALTGLL